MVIPEYKTLIKLHQRVPAKLGIAQGVTISEAKRVSEHGDGSGMMNVGLGIVLTDSMDVLKYIQLCHEFIDSIIKADTEIVFHKPKVHAKA